jgi:DNA processing protein
MFFGKVNTLKLTGSDFPESFEIINPPVKQLFCCGMPLNEWLKFPKVAIVGSRKISTYGKYVTQKIAFELAQHGVIVISGLAYGVDIAAHRAALSAGGITVAVLPSSLDRIYPAGHFQIAQKIINSGGALISEYLPGAVIYKNNFIARNRIISGLADAVLITEAASNSGSLHTAKFALEQGKTVMAIPGNITNTQSQGTNNLIKSGALPVTSTEDVLFGLGYKAKKAKGINFRGTEDEERVLKLIKQGVSSHDDLTLITKLPGAEINQTLTALEIAGVIKSQDGGRWLAV